MKTRFCPSPTGLMHLGNLRTALFSALAAKSQGGKFLLRIEDTDLARSQKIYEDQIYYDLEWLGLIWNDGVNLPEASQGPYRQSERNEIYEQYYSALQEQKLAYPCFCSEEELATNRKLQLASGKPPRYPGTCRHLSQEQVEEKLSSGLKPALRFHVQDGVTIEFEDFVKGSYSFNSSDIGDFIIRKQDGSASFMFCNAIDDSMMEVTHALRGEDHLTNTPRQIMILKALNMFVPQYGHMPLIVGNDGSPLSKRHGSKNVGELRDVGFLPLALLNYLARLGHTYVEQGFMHYDELAKNFDIQHVNKSPAKYGEAQLKHWQKEAEQQLSVEAFIAWIGRDNLQLVDDSQLNAFVQMIQPNVLFPADAIAWANYLLAEEVSFGIGEMEVLKSVDPAFFAAFSEAIQAGGEDYSAMLAALKEKTGLKGKALFQPLRIAMTSQLNGPDMSAVYGFLGVERLKSRIDQINSILG